MNPYKMMWTMLLNRIRRGNREDKESLIETMKDIEIQVWRDYDEEQDAKKNLSQTT